MAFEDDLQRQVLLNVLRWQMLVIFIAKIKSIDDSGLVAVSLARPYVEPILRKQEKAELIKAK